MQAGSSDKVWGEVGCLIPKEGSSGDQSPWTCKSSSISLEARLSTNLEKLWGKAAVGHPAGTRSIRDGLKMTEELKYRSLVTGWRGWLPDCWEDCKGTTALSFQWQLVLLTSLLLTGQFNQTLEHGVTSWALDHQPSVTKMASLAHSHHLNVKSSYQRGPDSHTGSKGI